MAKEMAEEEGGGTSGRVQAALAYLSDARNELRKVTWPQRKEAVAGTIGVIVIVAVITVVLGVVDMTLAKAVEFVLP
jgi:preprotein translocase subunit SecE